MQTIHIDNIQDLWSYEPTKVASFILTPLFTAYKQDEQLKQALAAGLDLDILVAFSRCEAGMLDLERKYSFKTTDNSNEAETDHQVWFNDSSFHVFLKNGKVFSLTGSHITNLVMRGKYSVMKERTNETEYSSYNAAVDPIVDLDNGFGKVFAVVDVRKVSSARIRERYSEQLVVTEHNCDTPSIFKFGNHQAAQAGLVRIIAAMKHWAKKEGQSNG